MGWMVKGGARIVDDSAINLSRSMYQKFCLPYKPSNRENLMDSWVISAARGNTDLPEILATPGSTTLTSVTLKCKIGKKFINRLPIIKFVYYGIVNFLIKETNQDRCHSKRLPHSWIEAKQIAQRLRGYNHETHLSVLQK